MMNRYLTLTAAAALVAFCFAGPASSGMLGAPGNLVCNVAGSDLDLSWDPVAGAETYAVDIVCFDAEGEVTAEISEGTSACSTFGSLLFTDGDCDIDATEMIVPISEVTFFGAMSGDTCTASVRGLHERGSNQPTVHLPESDMCGTLP